jgi:hypothetical protein
MDARAVAALTVGLGGRLVLHEERRVAGPAAEGSRHVLLHQRVVPRQQNVLAQTEVGLRDALACVLRRQAIHSDVTAVAESSS